MEAVLSGVDAGGAGVSATGTIVLSDLIFASLKSIVHPMEAKCVKERLGPLAAVLTAVREKSGQDWAAFSPEQRPYLKL